MFCATTMVAVLLILLGLFHSSGKVYYKYLYHAINSIRTFTFGTCLLIGTLFFQMNSSHSRGLGRLRAFQILQRKETCHLGFTWFTSGLAMERFHHLLLLGLPWSPKVVRVHLLVSAGSQVGQHGLEPYRESAIEMIMLQLSYIVWGKHSRNDAVRICRCLDKHTPQSDTISFSPKCNIKSSWFKVSKALTLL